MKYHMPTAVFCEPDCIAKHADEIAATGTHALIVTGKSSAKKCGALDDVISVLERHRLPYTVFDAVEENPSVETVMKARVHGLSAGADFVVGIGGGSPLDAAKATAFMLSRPESDWQALYTPGGTAALPIIAVPTTCGTGSEVTGVSVLTRHDLQTKLSATHSIFPKLALIDGKYLSAAPHSLIVNTAVDALAHLIESCINTKASCFSDMNAFAGLQLWRENRTFIEREISPDADTAMKLMQASAMAGMAIAQTGTTLPHALSYMLTYRAGIPHGIAVGAFQANYLELAEKNRRDAVLQAAGFRNTEELRTLLQKLVPLRADSALLEASAEAVLHNRKKLALCPFPVDEAAMCRLISI